MKLVVNYLKEVEELFNEGKIDFVDYFKLYSLDGDLTPMDWCIEHRPVMFHGLVGKASVFGDANLIDITDIKKTKEVLIKTKTPYLSGHICTRNKEQSKEQTIEAIKENVKQYREIFGKEIVLENIPYRDYFKHCDFLLDPELISKIICDNDCMFLFDISHARKAALYLNMPFEEYVSKLPMDRVVEFHLAGMFTMPDGSQIDNHGKLNEEDYEFLEEAIKKYPTLKYITLEYGSHLPKGEKEEEMPYPVASFKKVNPVVKEEVLEQLTRIKEIIQKAEKL